MYIWATHIHVLDLNSSNTRIVIILQPYVMLSPFDGQVSAS